MAIVTANINKKIPGKFGDPGDFSFSLGFFYLNEIPSPAETTLYWDQV
jgi:hypothetical protein